MVYDPTVWRTRLPPISKASDLKKHLLQGCLTFKHLKHLHGCLLRLGIGQDNYLLNIILKSSFNLGHPNHARLIFSSVQEPNIFLWNSMIRGFVSNDCFLEAVEFYSLMRQHGLLPNNFTFPFVLKACARIPDFRLGVKIHTLVLKAGFEWDVFVKTSLVSLYAKCSHLCDAHKLFDEIPLRNVVSWTAIICGYMEDGRFWEAVDMFRRMLEMDLRPDSFTLVRVLSSCSQLGDLKNGEWIHAYIVEKGMERNVFVGTALVDMYAKCGSMEKARSVFIRMEERDVVSWSTMISGYSSNGLPKEALDLFFQMQDKHVRPDCFTMVAVLSACARLGALDLGNWASSLINKNEFMSNPVLGTALIDMYAKCGCMARAWAVFKGMKQRDLVVWNAVINGLGMSGHGKITFGLFNQIQKLGIQPDGNTFIGLLCGCTHAGLVEDGRRYFESMSRVYTLTPRIEHYGCMVDLLGRAGLLDEAHQLIKGMPVEANAVVWGALLGGCRIYRDTHLAEHVLKQLIELEPMNAGNYVLLSNIYAANGQWDDAANLRLVMNRKNIRKTPGCSWIELNGIVHEFLVGDRSHPLSEKIYLKLDELAKELKGLGYVPTTETVLFDIEEEEKEHSLGCHSEKLAIAFGLISTMQGDVIRVVKNLRVCNDCHTAIKLMSKITGREVVVRDNNRFHCFREGSCSCRDYW
ncbi:putative pentatricopeptide repeat-containing protein At3g08820 [Magnolia sinica]|uniref:putative pentatricopeptide repeat-containing protein At3g08820 n=1 Tax=Magnolia sinica TaxID=86752 RepID=UPI00265A7B6A|nr:putative pentatricopeptide repeat-containing protein At3g08820 [Magnolia sinica]